MVVGQSLKQYFKQEILLDLAACSLSVYSKAHRSYPEPLHPQKTRMNPG